MYLKPGHRSRLHSGDLLLAMVSTYSLAALVCAAELQHENCFICLGLNFVAEMFLYKDILLAKP